ncbi:flagella assembly protein FlgT middle domain-containing protein [Cellvibrio sp. NN19]|uniref:flagella assembly protein FlgT middle domain-containing protein n=1 Tax=Cellvibrio chitinivorans TaxID=3102792 RepID=UPI002B40DC1D|nr:flagella assembly protein FlgT middle domain-containing protein [Cellvibrio sp. NN19]
MFAATPIYKPLLLGLILISSTSCSYLCDCKSDDKSNQDTVAGGDESVYVDSNTAGNNTAGSDQHTSITSGSSAPVATFSTSPVNSGKSVSVSNAAPTPPAAAPVVGTAPVSSNSGAAAPQAAAQQNYTAANTSSGDDRKQSNCPDPSINEYKKSIAFTSFPRRVPSTGNLGGLQHVEQQLPELLGGNLHNRHSMLALTYLKGGLQSANARGEINAATQAQTLSKQHRVQFVVSGEVDDMTLSHPETVVNPGLYTRFMNGTHDLLHINTPLDKRYRAFNFKVEVRDGFTGHIVFTNHYHTFGKWKVDPHAQVGFGSPEFWETDYGSQVQQLISLASDEMASTINCQPYIARIDAAPGQQQIVIHSGNSNGLHSGDTLDLYQLVYQPITGEYQRSDTRLVKRSGRVQLIETYPSHSIGNVIDETLLGGQYVVKAR